jgi:hypothetical protein
MIDTRMSFAEENCVWRRLRKVDWSKEAIDTARVKRALIIVCCCKPEAVCCEPDVVGGGAGAGGGGDEVVGGGAGVGGSDDAGPVAAQSVQSVPLVQALYSEPGPPSSHMPSVAYRQVSVQELPPVPLELTPVGEQSVQS